MNSFILIALVLANGSEAIFRSRLNKFATKSYQDDKLSLNMGPTTTHMVHSNHGKRHQMNGKCQVPCQRESFWIPFTAVMELGNIPTVLRGTIQSKAGNMIDIGKCIGFCRPSEFSLYQSVPVSDSIVKKLQINYTRHA